MRAGCRATTRLRRPERRRRLRRVLLLALAAGLAAWGATRLVRPAAAALGGLAPFQVRRVVIAGNRHLPVEAIRALVPVREGDNLLLLDSAKLAAAIRAHPRIERARVVRGPGLLAVEVREREPFILLHAGSLLEVDSLGTILPRQGGGQVPDCPVVTGLSVPTRQPGARVMTVAFRDVLRLARELNAPEVRLLDDIAEIVAVDARRVVLRTSPDQIPILVDPSRANRPTLRALAATLRDARRREPRVLSVDARYRGQVVVRCAPDSVTAPRGSQDKV